ncbi:uncharacterized protein LOC111895775 [Lactuca sativa]|uniref:uncharacterized protein LOC111895775 n=1 Tax=Lactuca sativa TaxID=4236 RepID=UPI000CD9C7EE|nr:uncharacterized protein LOC111895775 [Lactuca sativa]
MSRDCPNRALICFHCNQIGHKKADLSRLSGGPMVAPAPTTLRITNGHQGKAEAPVVKSRAFQLTIDEARAAPNVVTGNFLVNGVYAHVLFDSGATQSFVSLVLNKRFRDTPWTLSSPLEVEIVDDRTESSSRVFHGCVMSVFSERFSIDLVPVTFRGMKRLSLGGIGWALIRP